MLEKSKFIVNTKQVIDTEPLWKNVRFNDRSWVLRDAGGLPCFVKEIEVSEPVKSAVLTIAALGIFEAYINGRRVGADELKPGYTDYRRTVYAFQYDIADYLTEGKNTFVFEVSTGWYNGRISCGKFGWKPNAVCAEIKINDDVYVTDEKWKTTLGGSYRFATIYDGVLYNANLSKLTPRDFATPVEVEAQILPAALPYIGVKSVMPALSATVYDGVTPNGSTYGEINVISKKTGNGCEKGVLKAGNVLLLDFEQNMVGRPHLMLNAPYNAKVTVRFAEMLNDSGEESRGNDYAKGSAYLKNYRSAVSRCEYISDGKSVDFAPYHTFYGFRYMEIVSDADIEIDTIEAEVIGNKNKEIGKFECSDKTVNKLFSNILWGARGNYVSIPTDCPQRDERQGWSGDTQVFCGAGAYLMDTADFMRKWLHDARDCQALEGGYGDVIPLVFGTQNNKGNINSTAWGDAGIIVPYTIYKMFGDRDILESHYESMEEFFRELAMTGQHNNYGDWLSYEPTDKDYISACYYCYDLELMVEMSKALGKTDKAEYYKSEFDRIHKLWTDKYVDSEGLKEKSQTSNILALGFGLLDGKAVDWAKMSLSALIRDNDYTHKVGFVGCGAMMTTLAKCGLDDLAYNLLLCRNDPSWLYSVDQGATTVWERWNSYTKEKGFGDVGMNSFNHYAYGAVAEWMFAYMCGIRCEFDNAGFSVLTYDPRPDMRTEIPAGRDKITYAKASYESRAGEIKSEWKALEEGFEYKLTTPVKTVASVPAVKGVLTVNGKKLDGKISDGKFVFELTPGEYTIIA